MYGIRRKSICTLIILLPIVFALGGASISWASVCDALNVPEITQDTGVWCWAACTQAVLQYYGIQEEQCDVVNVARELAGWGSDDCCIYQYGTSCYRMNWLYDAPGSVYDILQQYGVNSSGIASFLTLSQVEHEISNGKPFLFRWGGDGYPVGHFLVGRGVCFDNLFYLDPLYGYGFSPYDWVVHNEEHDWTHTLYTNSPFSEYAIHLNVGLSAMGPPSEYMIEATVTYLGSPAANVEVTFSTDHGVFTGSCSGTTCNKTTAGDGTAWALLSINDFSEFVKICLRLDFNTSIQSCVTFMPVCPPSICPSPALSVFDTMRVNAYSNSAMTDDLSGGLRWSPDGSMIAGAALDTLRIADYPAKTYHDAVHRFTDATDLTWKPDGTKLMVAWEYLYAVVAPSASIICMPDIGHDITACSWNASNVYLATEEPSICPYTESGTKSAPCMTDIPPIDNGDVNAIDYCPATGRLAVVGGMGASSIIIYNANGTVFRRWDNQVTDDDGFYDCDWNPSNDKVVASGENGTLKVYSAIDGSVLPILWFDEDEMIYGCRFIDDLTIAATSYRHNKIVIFDISGASPVVLGEVSLNGAPIDLDFDPNRMILAACTKSRQTYLINMSDDHVGPFVTMNEMPLQPSGTDSVIIRGTISDPSTVREAFVLVQGIYHYPLTLGESGEYEVEIELCGDSTSVVAKAYDFYRNTSFVEMTVRVEEDNAPPIIFEIEAAPSAVPIGNPVAVTARIIDIDSGVEADSVWAVITAANHSSWKVALVDDGTGGDVSAGDTLYTGVVSTASLAPAVYHVSIEAWDRAYDPNVALIDSAVSFLVYAPADVTPPSISGVAIIPSSLISGESVSISATVADDGAGVNPDAVIAIVMKPDLSLLEVGMNDNGSGGDAFPGDDVYTAVYPTLAGDTGMCHVMIRAGDLASPPNIAETGYDYSFDVLTPPIDFYHDDMADCFDPYFQWICNAMAYFPANGGYATASDVSWDAATATGAFLTAVDNNYVVVRFEYTVGATNVMVGLRDNLPNPADPATFHYSNYRFCFYWNSGGAIRIYSNGEFGAPLDTLQVSGWYDLRITLSGSSGKVNYALDSVPDIMAPRSNFASPEWAHSETRALPGSYHLQINPYSSACKISDVWSGINAPPVISQIDDVIVFAKQSAVIDVECADPDYDAITCSISDPRFSKSGCTFSWDTELEDVGSYDVIISCMDGQYTVRDTVNVRVNLPLAHNHDPMISNENDCFDWIENGVVWNAMEGGFVAGSSVSWESGGVSNGTVKRTESTWVTFRFELVIGATNIIFGLRDDLPTPGNSATFHYGHIDFGVYFHSLSDCWIINNGGFGSAADDTLGVSGVYDFRISLDGTTGKVTYSVDAVPSIDAPMSDFSHPEWTYTEYLSLLSAYHIQINTYSSASKAYDVWATSFDCHYPTPVSEIPAAARLYSPRPNPFNPVTMIAFELGDASNVTLRIYDAQGQLVCSLIDGRRGAGHYEVIWDGLDDAGRPVSSGVYFCRLRAGSFSETKKMVLLR